MFSFGTGSAAATAPALEPKLQHQEWVHRPLFEGREKQKLVLCLALMAATLVFYNSVAHNGFVVFDDDDYIVNNPHVRAGITWSTLKWAFSFYSANWHPLTWLSHALDCQLFGLNPTGHHYVSLLFHTANAMLLFLVLEEATVLAWPSLIVAAIFALHPVNVESVAWAAERKNVLSMFFFLLAMLAYGRYARRGGVWRYLAVNACFVLGMMSKPQIITLPFVLLLWDYWPLKRMFGQNQRLSGQPPQTAPRLSFLLIEKIPLFAVALAGSIVTVLAQGSGEAVRTFSEVSLKARLENVPVSYVKYLGLLIWPRHLAPLYPHPADGIPVWQIVASCLVLLGLSATALRCRQRKYLAVGWLWFLGVLVPMIGIVQVGEQAMADRYLYIPMIGILIALVWAVWQFAEENALSKHWIGIPAVGTVLVLGALTHHQLGYWKDGETLWRYTISVTKANYVAHDMLGVVLHKKGRVEEAIAELEKAESLHNYRIGEVFLLGEYVQQYGHLQDATRLYAKVASTKTATPRLRSMALSQMGIIDAQTKDYVQAQANYQHALEVDPKNVEALAGTALLAERSGDLDQAIAQLSRSAEIRADDVTFLLLEDVLDRASRTSDALEAKRSAVKASSDIAKARRNAAEMEKLFGLAPVPDAAR
jgi:protein O-mannosyl-transferase